MALTPTPTEPSSIDEAFVADRAIFWGRFTNFVKYGSAVIVLLLIGLLLFVY